MFKLYINPKNQKGHINAELQGHFSEHLGRCIYEGIYVGEHSDIPNTNGMRNDVVACDGRADALRMNITGGTVSDRKGRERK